MDDEKLVSAVHQRPAIYNKHNKLHHNRDFIAKQWKEIAAEMDLEVERCKARWAHIRDYFMKQFRGNRYVGQAAANKRKWHLYDLLSFLIPLYEPRETSTTVFMDGSDVIETDAISQIMPSPISLRPDSPPAPVTPTISNNRARFKRKLINSSASEVETGEILKTFRQPEDEDELWARSIIPSMKRLEHLDKLQFRLEVQSLLLRFLRNQEEQKPSVCPSRPGPSQESSDALNSTGSESFQSNQWVPM